MLVDFVDTLDYVLAYEASEALSSETSEPIEIGFILPVYHVINLIPIQIMP